MVNSKMVLLPLALLVITQCSSEQNGVATITIA